MLKKVRLRSESGLHVTSSRTLLRALDVRPGRAQSGGAGISGMWPQVAGAPTGRSAGRPRPALSAPRPPRGRLCAGSWHVIACHRVRIFPRGSPMPLRARGTASSVRQSSVRDEAQSAICSPNQLVPNQLKKRENGVRLGAGARRPLQTKHGRSHSINRSLPPRPPGLQVRVPPCLTRCHRPERGLVASPSSVSGG